MFYAQIRKLCEERGEKLTPVVKKLGLSAGGLSRWQNGAIPTGEVLLKFAEYFGVSTDYLLGLSEQRENNVEVIKTEESMMETLSPKTKEKIKEAFDFLLNYLATHGGYESHKRVLRKQIDSYRPEDPVGGPINGTWFKSGDLAEESDAFIFIERHTGISISTLVNIRDEKTDITLQQFERLEMLISTIKDIRLPNAIEIKSELLKCKILSNDEEIAKFREVDEKMSAIAVNYLSAQNLSNEDGKAKENMKELLTAKNNIDRLLGYSSSGQAHEHDAPRR